MAMSRQSLVQDKIGDMTECSICAEIFTNPKILPCVHTFCLHCLETYGKDKQPGVKIACPICRNEFAIPNGGLRSLPNNFFIGEMVAIGKLSISPPNEVMCSICPEGEELVANMYCIECEQIICERCSKSHKKTKSSQNHQIVELGSKLNVQNFSLRNSYCDHHPKELIKMYCYNDNVAICLICCVESHQSHRCVNVDKVAGEFTKQLKVDQEKVIDRLLECEPVWEELDMYKKKFLEEISKTEDSIRDTATKLKELVDRHTEILVQNLKSVREKNLKAVEVTKQDVERLRVMIDSFSMHLEELLSQGSPVDICRAGDQMHRRANELEKLSSSCRGGRFRCNTVAFQPSSFENIVRQCRTKNIVGEITVTESSDRIIKFENASTDGVWTSDAIQAKKIRDLVPLPGFITITTEERGMLDSDDSPIQKRAKMPCGHVIGPDSMMDYCHALLRQGKYKFCCPNYTCNREWEYFLVRHVACLSPDEMKKVEKNIADNYLRKTWDQFRKCPGCQIWCFRGPDERNNCVRCPICTKTNGGAGYTFCWDCENEWQQCSGDCGNPKYVDKDSRLQVLATCPTKRICRCVECPCIRGCQNCGVLIEHKSNAAAHVTCHRCSYGFCFICLKEKLNGIWRCPLIGTCKLAPRQIFFPDDP